MGTKGGEIEGRESDAGCLSRATGVEFLTRVAEVLRLDTESDFVFIGELCGEAWQRVRTVAFSGTGVPGEMQPPGEHELHQTALEGLLSRGTRVYPSGVQEAFPADPYLKELGVESFAGIRLEDDKRRPLGVVGVGKRRPFGDPDRILSNLGEYERRIASELAHRRTVQEMRALLEETTVPPSTDVFRQLARVMARTMHVRTGVVIEYTDGASARGRIVTVSERGAIRDDLENVDLDFRGHPCEHIAESSFLFHGSRVRELYPSSDVLAGFEAEAYVGAVAFDSNGRMVGHVALIHDRPLDESALPKHLLRAFAARVGAELQRGREERERLEVERRLLESQKEESLGILAGGVAHDFNNLLMGVLGNVNLALLETPESSPVVPFLEEIEAAAGRAADLARQMLAYSGKGRFVLRTVDLGGVVRETSSLLRASVPRKIGLRFDLGEPGTLLVQVDDLRLRQAVMNLVLNAAEAIGEGTGAVTVSAGRTHLRPGGAAALDLGRELPSGDYVFLEVADTGNGLDEKTRARMFDPFFTTKANGRGLGLAAVKGIVRGHSAGLRVSSVPGSGTVVRMLFTPAQEEPGPSQEHADDALWEGTGTILVVDDEETVRVATTRMLQRIGFDVVRACDGRAGVDEFTRDPGRFTAVLLDLTMPLLSGEEALRELHALDESVPVILMSGHSKEEAIHRFTGQRLAGVLQKPFDLEELRRVLRRALG